jgi:SulP family sulfate permease
MMVMERAGFIDRLGRENVCPHIDAALDRAREILGLPPAKPLDPNYEEKKKLEAVRLELASALDRVNDVLKSSAGEDRPSNGVEKTGKITAQLN